MKHIFSFLIAAPLIALAACSMSGKADTREEQEAEFKAAFGFSPPAAIAEIKYGDLYNRRVMEGSYYQWMRFTIDAPTFAKIVASGFRPRSSTLSLSTATTPDWWAAGISDSAAIYVRRHSDTPEDEGFSFEEVLWENPETGYTYYRRKCWD
ncbi:MAG: hypothetical protein R3F11_03550 [Verrucomicrobiales bacterium]